MWCITAHRIEAMVRARTSQSVGVRHCPLMGDLRCYGDRARFPVEIVIGLGPKPIASTKTTGVATMASLKRRHRARRSPDPDCDSRNLIKDFCIGHSQTTPRTWPSRPSKFGKTHIKKKAQHPCDAAPSTFLDGSGASASATTARFGILINRFIIVPGGDCNMDMSGPV